MAAIHVLHLLHESKSYNVYNFIIYTGKNIVLDREFEDLPISSHVKDEAVVE